MKMKDRIKSPAFWAGLVGAVILILGAFGVEISDEAANTAVNAVCSLLVVLGIASSPKPPSDAAKEAENTENEEENST